AHARAAGHTGDRTRHSPRGPRTTPDHSCRAPRSLPGGRSSCTWFGVSLLSAECLLAERKDLLPAVHSLFLTVRGPIVVEEAVSGPVVAMKLVLLSVLLELGLVKVDLLRRGRLVLIAEETENRTGEILGVVDGRDRLVRRELLLGLDHA